MSFDVLFHTCNLGACSTRKRNPFTGKPMQVFDDPGLTSEEREAVEDLLKKAKVKGPDDYDVFSLAFPDGGEADFSGPAEGTKFDSCSVTTRQLSSQVVIFLFQLSQFGNLILLPAAEGVEGFVTSEERRRFVSSRWPAVKVVGSAAELEAELLPAFEDWRKYLDRISEDE